MDIQIEVMGSRRCTFYSFNFSRDFLGDVVSEGTTVPGTAEGDGQTHMESVESEGGTGDGDKRIVCVFRYWRITRL